MCAEKLRSFVKDDPKVTDIITEDKVRKGFSDQASVNIRHSSTTTQPNKLSFSRVEKESVGSKTTRQRIHSWAQLAYHSHSTVRRTVMAHWLRRLLSTGGSWVRLPLWPSRRDLGQVLYLQLPVRFGVKLRYSIRAVVGSASEW